LIIANLRSSHRDLPSSVRALSEATPAVRREAIKIAIARIPIAALQAPIKNHDDRAGADLRRIKIRLLRRGRSETGENGRNATAKRTD
jgi:hypothetical protein